MGQACSSGRSADEKKALEENKKIEESNNSDFANESLKIKLLLLGAGSAGKTTIFKQMKILYGDGYKEEERAGYKNKVRNNVLVAMRAVCGKGEEFGFLDAVEAKAAYEEIMKLPADSNANNASAFEDGTTMADNIKALWADAGFQQVGGCVRCFPPDAPLSTATH